MRKTIVIILVIILILLLIPFKWTGQKNDDSDTSQYKKSHSVYALLWQYAYSCEDYSSVEIEAYKVNRKITLFGFIVVYDKYELITNPTETNSSTVRATTEEVREVIIGDSHNDPFVNMDKISKKVFEYKNSDAYANDDVSVRLEKIADILYELEEIGYIQPDGVFVSDETALVSCNTIDGSVLLFECDDEDSARN